MFPGNNPEKRERKNFSSWISNHLNFCKNGYSRYQKSNDCRHKNRNQCECWRWRSGLLHWDGAKHGRIRRRSCTRAGSRRVCYIRSISGNKDVEFQRFLTVPINTTGEVEITRFGNIEKRVSILHFQDRIFKVTTVKWFFSYLNHWILTWRIKKNCSKRTDQFESIWNAKRLVKRKLTERISNLEVMILGPFNIDIGIFWTGRIPTI